MVLNVCSLVYDHTFNTMLEARDKPVPQYFSPLGIGNLGPTSLKWLHIAILVTRKSQSSE